MKTDLATLILVSTLSLSFLLVLFIRIVQWRALRRKHIGPSPEILPGIRILKPLKGLDPGLRENLESFFVQDRGNYGICMGTREADDPALEVAREVAAAHSYPPASMVTFDINEYGPNPKVSNLQALLQASNFSGVDLLLISDSNVRVRKDYLKGIVARYLENGSAGLVWSLFRATGERGLGGTLEALQVNTFVLGGMAAMAFLGVPGALGKSMLIHRRDLDRIGGFEELGNYIAEDQVMAEEISKINLPLVMSNDLVDNVIGPRTFIDFAGRHLRWAALRWHLKPMGYLFEILLNPVFLAAIGATILRTHIGILLFLGTIVLSSVLDLWAECCAGVRRNPALYPVLELILGISKGILWFIPFFRRSIFWRGNRIKIGPRTRIPRENKPAPESLLHDEDPLVHGDPGQRKDDAREGSGGRSVRAP